MKPSADLKASATDQDFTAGKETELLRWDENTSCSVADAEEHQ